MNYVIFTGGERNSLFNQLFSDLEGLNNVILKPGISHIPNNLQGIWKKHHSPNLNKNHLLPFRSIWNKYSILDAYKNENYRDYCFVFNNVSIEYMEPSLLKYLKRKYNIKLVLYLLDTFKSPYTRHAKLAMKYVNFDKIYTFHKADATDGINYFDMYYSKQEIAKQEDYNNDVFFWGCDFGRAKIVEDVHKLLRENNISSDFGLCYVDDNHTKLDGITYNKPIEYDEVLKRLENSACILDVVGDYSGGVSLRYFEAVVYGKKLLTNNPLVKDMRFYNEKYIKVFKDINDIELDFLKNNEDVDYGYRDEFSPIHFIELLEMDINQ